MILALVVGRVLKGLAITFSGIAIGGAGFLVLLHIKAVFRGDWVGGAYASARTGFCIIVYLLAKLVIRIPELPATGDVYLYLVGLFLAGAGYAFLAARALVKRKEHKRS